MAALKFCTKCKQQKPLTEFHKRTRNASGRQSGCVDCNRELRKKRRPEKFGITLEQFQLLFDNQQGRCAVCGTQFSSTPCIDHDHRTGDVRGLLCFQCNLVLGNAQDSITVLRSAIKYLQRNGENHA